MRALVRKYIAGNASFWGLMEYGLGPLIALAATPILLRQLGTVGFGQFAMIMALAGFGNVANLGAAVTGTKLVSERLHEAGGAMRGAGVSFALVGCALAFVMALALAAWGGVSWLWPDATFGGIPVSTLALPAMVVYLSQQFDQLFTGCLKGREAFATTALCEVGGRFTAYGATCTVAMLTHSPTLASLTQAGGLLATGLIKMHVFARRDGHYVVRPLLDRTAMGAAFRFSRWSWLNSLSAVAFGSVDRILVGSLLGPATLAIYTVGAQIGQMIHTASVAVFQKTMPRVSHLAAGADGERAVSREVRRLMAVNLTLSVLGTAVALAASGPVLSLMLGHAYTAGHLATFRLLILAAGLLSLNVVAHFSLLGMGNSRAVAVLNGLAGVSMVCVLFMLVAPVGESAAGWARIAYSLTTLYGIYLALRQSRPPPFVPARTATR
ncbi:lipopolysaccharide biosynthesis protein [Bordetella bronchialis]|uniref:Polysaccharide biosynthesis family protein n=1 Tax=Bordetella bronchialis TaxID=463025 RepID=A0A193FU08_9BORD|nr:oligosaccharide flippase family protein [Bordetella bronchialis]ANN66156.1 polysaccharide biosynthesis family protein [Bordetella bronchialis]ANN71237.1 polysaccharide biosynthesis family protein [Bordetella bronchialis]